MKASGLEVRRGALLSSVRAACRAFCPGGMAGIKGEMLSALHFIYKTPGGKEMTVICTFDFVH